MMLRWASLDTRERFLGIYESVRVHFFWKREIRKDIFDECKRGTLKFQLNYQNKFKRFYTNDATRVKVFKEINYSHDYDIGMFPELLILKISWYREMKVILFK